MLAVVLLAVAFASAVSAAQERFDCVLTDTEAKPNSENRPVVVIFDERKRTLTAEESGSQMLSFRSISSSNVSVNGQADSVSLSIDRSSFGIVWQRFGGDQVRTEYGRCHLRQPS